MRRHHPTHLSQHPTGAHHETSVPRAALRARAGIVVDAPVPFAARMWAATLWPDRAPGRWARALWEPHPSGRGWALPALLALGDVIEFGAVAADVDRRWWGIVDTYEPDAWLTLLGPFPTPAAALDLSRALLDAERPQPLRIAGDRPGPRAAQRQRRSRCHR